MQHRTEKIMFLFSIILALVSAWNLPFMSFIKDLIVLFHEICHATATILTGGKVHSILIHGHEAGETLAYPGAIKASFIFSVSAGYIGSSFLGGLILTRGYGNKYQRYTIIMLGLMLILFTWFFSKYHPLTYKTGVIWGIIFILTGIISRMASATVLIFLGTSISLYSIYDLMDFFQNISNTDAGILAKWFITRKIFESQAAGWNERTLGYLIACIWSAISIGILILFMKAIFFRKYSPLEKSIYNITRNVVNGNVKPDVADWFLQRGIDFDGKPLPKELYNNIKKKK